MDLFICRRIKKKNSFFLNSRLLGRSIVQFIRFIVNKECLLYYITIGGTLKIYGDSVKPDVPYKTLLLSTGDTVAHVVRETLEKYGLEKDDAGNYCLVQVRVLDTLIP